MPDTSCSLPQDLGLPTHYRPAQWSAVWEQPPNQWREHLAAMFELDPGNHTPGFFFRADDIGAGGRAFHALCQLFRHHRIPVAMAVVPAWLSTVRVDQLFFAAPLEEPLWGWHQHGWRHVNYQPAGEKSEFGEGRPIEKQWRDISQGLKKMMGIFGDRFTPVFTPPWNRLSGATLRMLQELDFKAVSIMDSLPTTTKPRVGLRNLRIQLDLHTRKAKLGQTDFPNLLRELGALMAREEPIGIMLHHHRMTLFAFEFLDELLSLLKNKARSRFLSFADLLEDEHDE